ncbi:MAG: hypothetical protein P3X22_004695 [Thermoprotei archaeon]|nr:hypothetical protein [Thermoprotei archaeon]
MEVVGKVRLTIEASKSRSGLHAERRLAFIVRGGVELEEVKGEGVKVDPVYSRGDARSIEVNLSPGDYAVQVRLARGLRGRVKGYIIVLDSSGNVVYKSVLRKRKVRPSTGDKSYHFIVEKVVEALKLHKYLRSYKLKQPA